MKRLVGCVFGAALMCQASLAGAGIVYLTGADLFEHEDVTFFRSTPDLVGDSLVFDGPRTDRWEKLFDLPILTAGQISPQAPTTTISISMSLTRLTNDWDPYILLSDGTNLTGAVVSDNAFMQGLQPGASWLYDFEDGRPSDRPYPSGIFPPGSRPVERRQRE
jgi:hypothetical protein